MKLYGLIGYPLGHSFSKQYFNEKFEREGLGDCFFELFALPEIGKLSSLLATERDLKGLAVTIPYKEAVLPYLQSISADAKEIGAVNCIEVLPEGLRGHNTDVIGFEQSFVPQLQHHHTKALVLGTGGAAKAVQFVLSKIGMSFLTVSRSNRDIGIISYADVDEALLNEYTVVINCTPAGMSPREDEKPLLPYECINFAHYLFDLVYKPTETRFLLEGKRRGAVIKNGYDMLLIQAEENWKIWNEV